MANPYDAIIIGSGAGGGTLALHLTRAVNTSLTIIANAIRIAGRLT
jgi:hypothetical protein